MKETVTLESDAMTEAQAKVEVARMGREIEFVLQQIKRDRAEGERITARLDVKMAEVRALRDRVLATV